MPLADRIVRKFIAEQLDEQPDGAVPVQKPLMTEAEIREVLEPFLCRIVDIKFEPGESENEIRFGVLMRSGLIEAGTITLVKTPAERDVSVIPMIELDNPPRRLYVDVQPDPPTG